jgi:hypothetical protein
MSGEKMRSVVMGPSQVYLHQIFQIVHRMLDIIGDRKPVELLKVEQAGILPYLSVAVMAAKPALNFGKSLCIHCTIGAFKIPI